MVKELFKELFKKGEGNMRKFLSIFIAALMIFSLTAAVNPVAAADLGMHFTSPTAGATITTTSFAVQGTFDTVQTGNFKLHVVVGAQTHDYLFTVSGTTTWSAVVNMADFSAMVMGGTYTATLQAGQQVPSIPPVQTDPITITWHPTVTPPPTTCITITDTDKVAAHLYYYDPVPVFGGAGTVNDLTKQFVYKMGDVIHGYIDTIPTAPWRVELRKTDGTPVDSVTMAAGSKYFTIGTGNVSYDGEYYVVAVVGGADHCSQKVFIEYNLIWGAKTLNNCAGTQTISGWITRGNGQTVLVPVMVSIAYPDNTLAGQYVITPLSSGQFTIQFPADGPDADNKADIGKFRVFISDGYDPANDDNDAIIYDTLNNIPTVSITVSTYITPFIYKSITNQPLLLVVKDQDENPVTGLLQADWTVTNATVAVGGYSEIAPGFYRFVITPVTGKVDVRFSVSFSNFGHTYPSNLLIINLRDLGQFNPYVDINTSDSPYFFQEIATVVYDKLPCQIGYSFDIIPGLWEPAQSDKFVVYDSSFEVTGPVYRLVSDDRTIQIGGTIYPVYKLDELGEGSKYFVYDQGDIKVHFEAVIWERISEDCEISEYNACCHNYSKDVSICSVQTCPAVTPTLSDGTTTVEVGKETGLKFSVSNKTAPTDLECGCDWKIYMMYMTDQWGNIINNAFKIKTRFGTTKNVSILLYNAVYDKYYSLGGYWLGLETRIPDLFTTFVSTYFGAGDPDLDVHDRCEVVDIAGVTFNYTNEPVYDANGVNISNHLVMKLFGTKVVTSTCGNDYVHPATYIGIDDISIVASQTDLVTEPTLTEGAQDPTQILAGIIPVIDVVIKDPVTHTVPGFSVDKGLYYWEDIVWEFYFNDKPLTGINVTVQPLDAQKGYRFALDKAFSKAGTFKIVGTSYYKDPTTSTINTNNFKKKEVATVEFEVVVPTFNVEIGLLDGTRIASDGILTEGFGEIIYVTPTDPRTDIQHDFAGDTWTLTSKEVLNDCGLATSYVCSGIIPNLCCGKQAIMVTAFDNPCVEEEPTVNIYFNLNGAKIKVTSLKVVPPTIKVSLEDIYGNPLEKAPVTVPPTNTHVIVTVKDAHNHGAPGVKATLGVESISGGSSGYVVTYGNSVSTNKNGEADFLSSFMSGKYYVSVDAGSKCELPCTNWTGIATELAFEAEYVKPVLDTTAPTVTVTAPEEVKTSTVKITGKATDNVGVVSVWVGAKQASVAPDGTFEAVLELVPGDNTFTVSAYDAATPPNVGTAKVTIKYVVPQVTKIVLKIGSDIMMVNDKAVQLDAAPEIKEGRTFLPLRAIAEAFGAQVTWVPDTKGITVVLGDTQIGLQIENETAVINGNVISIVAPYIKNGRTMVPFRVISEAFGADVQWDPINYIVTVTLQE